MSTHTIAATPMSGNKSLYNPLGKVIFIILPVLGHTLMKF
jgi:hypothetical protein